MERHDALTRRPSLLAGGPEPAGTRMPHERVLPSIDAGTVMDRTRQARRAWPWLLAVLALLAIALLAPWWPSPSPTGIAAVPATASGQGEGDAPPGAATIIEDVVRMEVAAGTPVVPESSLGAVAPAGGDAGTAPAASPPAAMARATDAPDPFTSKRPTRRSGRPAAADSASSTEESAPLLSALLEHIHAPPTRGSPMDRVVEPLANRQEVAHGTATNAPPFRSHQIQMNLRDCPPANTAEGVACRARICEVYAGRDPACPAG